MKKKLKTFSAGEVFDAIDDIYCDVGLIVERIDGTENPVLKNLYTQKLESFVFGTDNLLREIIFNYTKFFHSRYKRNKQISQKISNLIVNLNSIIDTTKFEFINIGEIK